MIFILSSVLFTLTLVSCQTICPDGSMCPDGNTCCPMASSSFGCCPVEDATCCPDLVHCCPDEYLCVTNYNICVKCPDASAKRYKITPLIISKKIQQSNVCPGGQEQCPDDQTCCQMAGGQFGCCPLPDAVCCSDEIHCCPNGYTCEGSECQSDMLRLPWFSHTSPKKTTNTDCPDGSQCPESMTCCLMAGGAYGCCPYSQAVCCSDLLHCCPSGTTCNVSAGTCDKGNAVIPWSSPIPAKKTTNTECPDGSQCPGTMTCCLMAGGTYGCCPYSQAVCCSDLLHCCPSGTTCNVSAGTCATGNAVIPWSSPIPAKKTTNTDCPDGSQCPGTMTCCLMAGGTYGCCPYSQAVCCSDLLHCCPSGTTCNVSAGTCATGNAVIPWSSPIPAKKTTNTDCPDGSQCPGTMTCCLMAGGTYGCCPYSQAVCCSDLLHCCPSGTTCNVSAGTCATGNAVIPWSSPIPAKKTTNTDCPDGSQCPGTMTCCLMAGGTYGCCPYSQAVCCSDLLHCCPSGTTCNVSAGTCATGNAVIPWSSPIPAKKTTNTDCPDGSQCPGTMTCCLMAGGTYGCCPYSQAVCCSDLLHCCQGGTTCDVSAGTCNGGPDVIPWFTKTPAINKRKNKIFS